MRLITVLDHMDVLIALVVMNEEVYKPILTFELACRALPRLCIYCIRVV